MVFDFGNWDIFDILLEDEDDDGEIEEEILPVIICPGKERRYSQIFFFPQRGSRIN